MEKLEILEVIKEDEENDLLIDANIEEYFTIKASSLVGAWKKGVSVRMQAEAEKERQEQ